MKILLFAKSIRNSAGIERMTVSLANELSNRGYMVSLVVCGVDKGSFYTLNENISIYALGVPFRNRLKAAYKLRSLIKNIKPNIFINVAVSMGQISFLSLFLFRDRPKVITWEHFHLHAGSRLGYCFRLLSTLLSDYTVVLTDCDKNKYPRFFSKNLKRIYNFTILPSQCYLRHNNKTVLTVGRLEKIKGYDLLLPIWKKVVDKVKDCKLLIVGDGIMKEELLQQIEQLDLSNSVRILPPTPKVADYYKASSIYVMTSRSEGLPMVLIEAKSCGMTCLSYNCPIGPHEIIRDAKDGYIIPVGNDKIYAQRLIELLQNPLLQEQFGVAAVNDVKARFSPEVIIKQWEELFNYLYNK